VPRRAIVRLYREGVADKTAAEAKAIRAVFLAKVDMEGVLYD
jgi:hypothetical protein